MLILIGALFVLPLLGMRLGVNLDQLPQLIAMSTNTVVDGVLHLTGNA